MDCWQSPWQCLPDLYPRLFLGLRAVALRGVFFTTLFLLLTGTPVHLLKTTGFFVGLK